MLGKLDCGVGAKRHGGRTYVGLWGPHFDKEKTEKKESCGSLEKPSCVISYQQAQPNREYNRLYVGAVGDQGIPVLKDYFSQGRLGGRGLGVQGVGLGGLEFDSWIPRSIDWMDCRWGREEVCGSSEDF